MIVIYHLLFNNLFIFIYFIYLVIYLYLIYDSCHMCIRGTFDLLVFNVILGSFSAIVSK